MFAKGYLNTSTSAYTLIDPVSITNLDKNGRATDQITSVRTTGSGALSPTDTFAQTDWKSWSSTQYDQQGHMVSQRNYFLIPSSGTGTAGVNYAETDFGYDALERQNRVESPVGDITRTVWTTPQWVLSIWMGTNDTGATDSDPAGGGAAGNNMVKISENQYDGGAAGGNGNVTEITQFVSATSGDTRVTSFGYDFRDRRINMTGEIDVYAAYTYDNLGRQTQVDRYDTSATGNLIGRSQMLYDDRGRVYQRITYAVDPATGTVGNALIGNTWFDPSGNVVQQIAPGSGQVFTKNTINGVGWVTGTYTGYNTTGTSYTQAGTVSGDIVVSQSIPTYNEVGSVISTATYDRLNDASTSTTGALTSSNARISYTAAWFDGIDRNIASANYGAISSFTRPSTPPSSSSTVLVSETAYDSAGRVYQITDPNGVLNQRGYDDAGRTTQTIEDFGGLARTTNFTYTLDSQIATLTAVNPTTGDQTTTYTYGTILGESGVARNDLLRYVDYPDSNAPVWPSLSVDDWADLSVAGWDQLQVNPVSDRISLTYNRLGEQATVTDQRGTVRALYRDKLGRRTNDCVPTVGADTDAAVLQIEWAYEVRGMVQTITSRDNATPGSGTVLNQVQLNYNMFSQLALEQQEHSGAVTGSTPSVGYGYDTGASGSNEIRPNQLTYPNGRTIAYNFGTSGGMDDYLNRVDTIQDTTSGTTDLASYTYLGLGTVVRITYPEPSVWLDLWGGTSGTFSGLDRFNRIIDQRWQNDITGTPTDIDRYQYGYDQNSNRLWKANVVGTAAVTAGLDEFYTYDPLNRLTEMQRGVLNSGKTGITGTPSVEQDWTLDSTGNWSNFTTAASGTTDLDQDRTANTVNEITNITESTGPAWIVPAYDAAGNTTTMPQVVDPTQSFTAVYDAWNRMVSISASSTTVAQYQYDGRNFRIVKKTYTSGVLSETRHFYFTSNWQNIEERVGSSTTMDKQYVWGIRYINELTCRDDATPQRLYVCQDANFNLTTISDPAGAVVERYLFDPYGSRTICTAGWTVRSATSYSWVIGHQGLTYDEGSGLIDNCLRMANPTLGLFNTRDWLGYRDGTNLAEYEVSNPVALTDPFGSAFLPAARRRYSPPAKLPPPYQGAPSTGCYIRTVCHKLTSHCGIYVSSANQVMAIDGAQRTNEGPVATIGSINTVPNPSFWYSALWFAEMMQSGPLNPPPPAVPPPDLYPFPPAVVWGRAAGPWPQDPWFDTKGSEFGAWTAQPQTVCDCLTSWNNQKAWNAANKVPYHTKTTNSDWALKCYLKQCGLTFTSWPGEAPIGWNDPTPCPTCNF